MYAIGRYFDELVTSAGDGWNRFWFTPTDPAGVSLLRVLAGSMALWFLISFSSDLTIWFAADGLLPRDMARQLLEDPDSRWSGRASYLFATDDPTMLTILHIGGCLVALAFTMGFATRVTSILTLIVVLSYVHRGPTIMGQFEPVLTFILFYLCFAPCHRRYSLDHWLALRQQPKPPRTTTDPGKEHSVAANICQRLIQVHIAALYLMSGLTKLAGEDWWSGEAMWWLIAHTESRLIDLTFLHPFEYLINLWTHAVVAFELLFSVLIWKRLARPLLLAIAVGHWLTLGLITGLVSYCLMMLVANIAFIDPDTIRHLLSSRLSRADAEMPSSAAGR